MRKVFKNIISLLLAFSFLGLFFLFSLALNSKGNPPILYLRFDEGRGNIVYDSSENKFQGTIYGALWKNEEFCKVGKCLYFDGVDDYIDLGTILPIYSGGITIEAWIKPTEIASGSRRFILAKQKSDSGTTQYSLSLEPDSDEISFYYHAGSGALHQYTTEGADLKEGEWVHIALSFTFGDGSSIRIYKNGNLLNGSWVFGDGNSTAHSLSGWTNVYLNIGRKPYSSSGSYFSGFIDEIKIYDYPRTKSQIRAEYLSSLSSHPTPLGASVSLSSRKKEEKNSLTEGLVLYLKMDENSGEVVKDFSGQGNDGTLGDGTCTQGTGTCPTWTGGKYGSALSFDGVDDYIRYDGMGLPNHMTVSVWIKTTSTTSQGILSKYHNHGYYQYKLYQNSDGTISFAIGRDAVGGEPGFTTTVTSQSAVNDGKWHHIVGSYDQRYLRIFIDGKKEGEVEETRETGSAYYFCIGVVRWNCVGSYAGMNYFSGSIDEVRLYSRTLSEKEVKALYEWGPPPILHLKFDEKTGQYAYDSSGNGNDGILGGKAISESSDPTWRSARLCKYGGCLEFDGVDDYVDLTSLSETNFLNTSFTIEAWIKIDSLDEQSYGGGKGFTIIEKVESEGSSNNVGFAWGIRGKNGENRHWFWNKGHADKFGNTGSFQTGRWYHVALVFKYFGNDSNEIEFYTNGRLDGEGTNVPDINSNPFTSTFKIGHRCWITGYADGLIDDIRIYNYARTQKQIIEDMNAGRPTISSPIGHTVLDLSFDEGYGQTAYDKSPYKNNGTIYGATWTLEGKIGKALSFDGVDDYVVTDTSSIFDIFGTAQVSVSAWVKSSIVSPAAKVNIVGITETGDGSIEWDKNIVITPEGKFAFHIWDGASKDAVSDKPNDGNWHFIVGIYDGVNVKIYVDGILQSTTVTATQSYDFSTPQVLIGGHVGGNNPYFSGLIDEVKIFPYALTDEEVKQLYNQGKATLLGKRSSASSEYCPPGETDYCAPPILHLTFDEKKGQYVYDRSGNGNDGILGGEATSESSDPTWRSARLCHQGGCLEFDGSDDYVDLGNPTSLNFGSGDFTIEAWFKTSSVDFHDAIFGSYGNGDIWLELLQSGGDRIRFVFRDGAGNENQLMPSFDYNDNQWHHIVALRDGDEGRIYIDGKLLATNTVSGIGSTDSGKNKYIGSLNSSYYHFDGLIDDVRIYNYARTPRQIAWDYSRGKPILYLKFDKGQGTTAYDWSGKGNHGTIYGATWTDNGKINRALSFDGVDDYVEISSNELINLSTSNTISISLWIKRNDLTRGHEGILNKASSLYSYDGYGIKIKNNHLLVFLNGNTANNSWEGSIPIADDKWHFIYVTVKIGGRVAGYVDGKRDIWAWDTNSSADEANPLKIGYFEWGGTPSPYYNYFSGFIDEVKIYNYALTEEQIKQEYNLGASIKFGSSEGTP